MSESYWWCPNCREEVDGHHVTYQEQHEACGHLVESITPEKQERIAELEAELAKVKYSAQQMFHEVEQTLGKAIRYPWFRDDPANFPIKALESEKREVAPYSPGEYQKEDGGLFPDSRAGGEEPGE